MVKTYIGAAGSQATTANTTTYGYLGGGINNSTNEAGRQCLFRLPGVLSNLYCRVTANAIAATSTVRTRLNAANGGQSVSIGSTATGEFTDASGTDTVSAGDKLNYQFVPGAATNTMTFVLFSSIFAATTDTVTRTICTFITNVTTASTTWYAPLCGDNGAATTTVTNAKQRMRKSFILKNAGVNVTTARATTTTVRIQKNGTDANSTVSCTGATTGWFEDLVNTDTISAGEDWNWRVTTGTGVDTLTIHIIAADLVSTNGDGFVGTAHMTTVAYTDNTTNYVAVSGRHISNATEANTKADCRIAGDYSELTCLVTQNGVTAASTVTLRKNGADSTLIISITASTTGVFSDSTHTETLVATDEINYEITAPSVAGTQTVSITNIVMFTFISVLTRISLSNIYKYNVIARVSLSRIYKYHVIGRISLARIYKYHVLQRVNSPSVLFDGINDYLWGDNDSSLWSQSLTKFSFSFWIYPTLAWDGTQRPVVTHGSGAQAFSCLFVTSTSGRIQFTIRNAANTALNSSSDSAVLNKWNFVTCVYDNSLGSANIKIYVNGTVGGTTANLTETINKSDFLYLSSDTTGFGGNIKDFRWWTTKALNSTEITDIYNNSAAAPTPDYWLPMNEGTGNTVDIISKTKTGTLANGATWETRSPGVLGGLTRIYRYNLLSRTSLARIYKYHILGRVSLSRIYKWNLLAGLTRISLSRVYKYNVATRVSLSRIYKYHVLGRISLARVYKYNVIGRISLARIYKYNKIGRISLSRIYKYNVIARTSLARVYKYHVLGRTSLVRIYKYHVARRVSLSRIYKYHVAVRVSLSRIYKYHVARRVSLSRIYKYHMLGRVSLNRIYKYHILGRVSLARIYKYHVLGRTSLVRIYKYHVLGRVSLARVYKYNVIGRVSLQRIYKYNVIGRISLARVYKFSVLVAGLSRVELARIYKYNVIQRTSLARVYKYNILSKVSLARVYKYHILGRVSLSRIYRYHVLSRVSLARIYKYHVLARVSLVRIYKYNLIGRVSLSRIYKWNVAVIGLTRISLSRVYKYHVLQRTSLARIYKYDILNRISLSRIYKYHVLSRVSLARVYKWNIISLFRVSLQQVYKYNIVGRISKQSRLKWNIATLAVTQWGKIREWIYAKYSETNPPK